MPIDNDVSKHNRLGTVKNPTHKPIRSFVIRSGRMTSSQRAAFDENIKKWGIELTQGLINFSEIFGNDRGVTLEIGFGMGDSLVEMAQHHPEKNFVGIEVHPAGIGRLLALIESLNLDNIRIIQADAVEVLKNHIAAHSIDQVNIFFPDPWHKTKHHKRRLIQDKFLTLLCSRLIKGGLIHFATDWQPYADYVNKLVSKHTLLTNIAGDALYVDPKEWGRPTTKFERRGLRLGHQVRDMLYSSISNKSE